MWQCPQCGANLLDITQRCVMCNAEWKRAVVETCGLGGGRKAADLATDKPERHSELATLVVKGLAGFLVGCTIPFGVLVVAFFQGLSPWAANWFPMCPIVFAIVAATFWPDDFVPDGWKRWACAVLLGFLSVVAGVVCFFGIKLLELAWITIQN